MSSVELPRLQSADCTTTHDQSTSQATATAAAANTQAEQSSTTHDQSTSQATAANTQAEQSSTFTISNTELPTITSEPAYHSYSSSQDSGDSSDSELPCVDNSDDSANSEPELFTIRPLISYSLRRKL